MSYSQPELVEGVRVVRGPVDAVYAKMVAIAVVAGIVSVFSASFPLADRALGGSHSFHFLYRQMAFALLGLVGMWGLTLMRPQTIAAWVPRLILPGVAAMVLCVVGPWAHEVAGASRWLKFGSVTVQPSEFVKYVYVIVLALIMSRPVKGEWTEGLVWKHSLAAMGAMCGLLLLQEDMGMAFLVVVVTLAMLFLRGLNAWLVSGLGVTLFSLGALVVYLFFPLRWQRIIAFTDPYADPLGSGYHMCQMLAALARGGPGGLGLGMSPDKWGALPAPHTDSIFCIMGAELGLAGVALLFMLIVLMASRGLKISERAGTSVAWYMGGGVVLMLAVQSLVNIAVATVSMPCTGLTLPFISYGGSSLVSSMLAAGVVLSISRCVASERG